MSTPRCPRFLRFLTPALAAALLVTPASAAEEPGGGERVTAAELLPLEEGSWPMKITTGPGAGEAATLALEPIADGEGWAMRLGDRNALRLHAAEDGGVEASEVKLTDAGQRLVFNPPALLVPATMTPGETFERSGEVKIYATDGGELMTSGSYEQTLPPPSRTRYELPSGTSEAFEVSSKCRIETDWASVELDVALGLSQEEGPVYRRIVSDVTKAAIFGSKTTRTIEQKLDN